jgi:phospholipid-binding lipoprotein MlaA
VLGPLADVWRSQVPLPVRLGAGRALANLSEPVVAASGLIAGDADLAWNAVARFGINSTLGYGGVRDPAAGMGYAPRRFDLADALCRWGVPSGPYLVLPLLGPATLREAGAMVLTAGALSQGLGAEAVFAWNTTAGVLTYAELHPALTQMDAAALDPYATQRSAHEQRRTERCPG